MPTLSVFCIGTGHTRAEQYNLLVALHALTAATDVPGAARPVPPEGAFGPNYKVIFDGPPNSDVGVHLVNVRTQAVAVLAALRSRHADPWTVNLAGHSRGAVECMMIGQMLQDSGDHATVNMFLVDTVKRSANSDEIGLRVFGNTHEFVQIVMEDDATVIFKLANIRANVPAGGVVPVLNHIRLPGTHGTASQCNPYTFKGVAVRQADLTANPPPRLWPIGSVAMRTALAQLRRWGTPLTDAGNRYIGQTSAAAFNEPAFREIMLAEYWRIVSLHPYKGGRRKLNDIPLSKPGEVQAFRPVRGSRAEELLGSRVANPFRFFNLFVNQQHFDFFNTARSTLTPRASVLIEKLRLIGSGLAVPELFNSANTPGAIANNNDVRTALLALNAQRPEEFEALARAGVAFNGASLHQIIAAHAGAPFASIAPAPAAIAANV